MLEWKLIRLGDICLTNKSSYSSKDNWKFVNYLDTGSLTENKITELQYINIEMDKMPSRARRKVIKNSILYSTVRPNQLHYGIIKEPVDNLLVSTGFTVIDVDTNKAIPEFIYYLLTQNNTTEQLQAIAEQSVSTYPSIKPSDIENLEFKLPNLIIQSKIVSILDTIDSKIRQNEKINNNLEQQAEALYKEYFAPADSEMQNIKTLDMFCNIFTGKKNSNASTPDGKFKFFTCSPEPLQIDSFIFDGNAIITSGNGAYTGRTRFYSGKFDLYQRTYACTLKEGFNSNYIFPLYWFVKLELSKKIMGGTRGSAIPYIVMNDLAKFEFEFDQHKFESYMPLFKSITETIQANENQNETLAQLRDGLLPSLMSGELDVSNIEI